MPRSTNDTSAQVSREGIDKKSEKIKKGISCLQFCLGLIIAAIAALSAEILAGLNSVLADGIGRCPAIGTIIVLLLVAVGFYFWGYKKLRKKEAERDELGTLYYVSILEQSMYDTHAQGLHAVKGAFDDSKVVTRRFPGNGDKVETDKAIDLCATTANAAHYLERSMNEDVENTQFSIMPNAVFPVCFGLGSQTYLFPKKTSIYEPLAENAEEKAGETNTYRWTLELSTREDDFAEYTTKGFPTVETVSLKDSGNTKSPKNVLLLWAITSSELGPEDTTLEQLSEENDLLVRKVTVNAGAINRLQDTDRNPRDNTKMLSINEKTGGLDIAKDHLKNENAKCIDLITAGCVQALWQTLYEFPEAKIIVGGRLTNAMQFVMGWRFSQHFDAPDRYCTKFSIGNPWERITTVSWGIGNRGPVPDRAYRINPTQPSIKEMIKQLNDLKSYFPV